MEHDWCERMSDIKGCEQVETQGHKEYKASSFIVLGKWKRTGTGWHLEMSPLLRT